MPGLLEEALGRSIRLPVGQQQLKMASFFSGIGGFDLGFERAGFKTVFQCEFNAFCNQVLERHWPDVPRSKDIREVSYAENIPASDVWTGGFPCQDVSLARMAPRMGLKGAKSGLFFEFARLLKDGRPGVVVIENVPGLLSSHEGKDFQIILQTLAELGYCVGWRVLNSKNFGVPQSRQRVFIVGCYRNRRGPGAILFEPERSAGDSETNGQNGAQAVSPFKTVVGDTRKGPLTPQIAYCVYACSARHTGTDWSRNYVSYPDGRVRRYIPKECELVQGFPADWTVVKNREQDPDKDDTLRYQAVGNAVTVPVAEWIARKVKAYLAGSATRLGQAASRTRRIRSGDPAKIFVP